MIIKFNDAGELMVRSVRLDNGRLKIITSAAMPNELKEKFTDEFACRRMTVKEDGKDDVAYEGYTVPYKFEEYMNGSYGVVLNKSGDSDADRIEAVNGRVDDIEAVIDIITGGAANG